MSPFQIYKGLQCERQNFKTFRKQYRQMSLVSQVQGLLQQKTKEEKTQLH